MFTNPLSFLMILISCLKQLGIATLYFLFGYIIHHYLISNGIVSVLWPGSGLALGALLVGGKRYIVGVMLGAFTLNFISHESVWAIAGMTLANGIEAFCGVWLLKHDNNFSSLDNLSSYLQLIILGGACSVVGSMIGAMSLLLADVITTEHYFQSMVRWWMGDTLGVALITPLVLAWCHPASETLSYKKSLENFFLVSITFVVGQMIFLGWWPQEILIVPPKGFVMFLFISWVAIRAGVRATTFTLNIIAVQALAGAYLEVGYFSADIQLYNLYTYWLFTLIISLVGMALTTYVEEIKTALQGLQLKDSALNAAANGIVITDIKGKIEWANQAFSELTGFNIKEIYSHHPQELLELGKQSPEYYHALWETILANRVWHGELTNRRKDGSLYDEEMTITPLANKKGKITHFVAVKQDITQRKQTELALKESHQQMFSLLNSLAEGAYGIDTKGNCTFVNQSFLQILGYDSPDEIVGKHIHGLIHHSRPDGTPYPAAECKIYAAYRENQEIHISNEVFWRKDGLSVPVEYWSRPIIIEGVMMGAIATFIDITKRKRAEHELRIAASVFESHEGMFVTDADNVILRVNHAFTNITGYSAAEAVGKNPNLLKSNRHNNAFYAAIWECVLHAGSWEGDIWNKRKNGEVYPQHLTITAVNDQNNVLTNYIAIFNDITESKKAMEEIERLAFYDPLTNLPNRRLLRERLKQALNVSHRSGKKGAVLFIDMDNFKTLNDSLGHDMGDLLLKQVAQRLKDCVRKHDTVARLGGDEFVVMLEGLSHQHPEAALQTENIGNKILANLNKPYQLVKHIYHSTPSIGATFFNGLEKEIDELLKQADIAMYQAKTSGRNALRFFDPQMQVNINARVALEANLRLAITEQQFELYYQPQIQHHHTIIGVEVFLRWHHPEQGLLTPADFISLAEETGLILPIGQWVLETACAQIKDWAKHPSTAGLQVAVNISPKQFRQANFVEQLCETLSRNAINPARLTLELTESLILHNVELNIHIMNTLREKGIKFSIDDFGSGYSSLACLTQLPLDQLKIDHTFINNIGITSSDSMIVQTIIGMGNNLGIEVIAKGVENQEQQKFLEKHGCSRCQGYLFGQLAPLAEFKLELKGN